MHRVVCMFSQIMKPDSNLASTTNSLHGFLEASGNNCLETTMQIGRAQRKESADNQFGSKVPEGPPPPIPTCLGLEITCKVLAEGTHHFRNLDSPRWGPSWLLPPDFRSPSQRDSHCWHIIIGFLLPVTFACQKAKIWRTASRVLMWCLFSVLILVPSCIYIIVFSILLLL